MRRVRLLAHVLLVSLVALMSFAGASGAYAQDAATPLAALETEATSGGWTNWKGDAGRTGVADAGPTGQPVELWRVQAGGSCNPSPAIASGVVYASCDDGILYALDAGTGAERWRYSGAALGDVTTAGELVYVNDADVLHAFDAATGQERWQAAVVGGTSAVVDDGLLVIGTGDGFLLGLEAATGTERWRFQVATDGAVHNPALSDGIAYAGGEVPGFFAVDAVTGELLWRGETGDDQTGTAVAAEGIAYLGGSAEGTPGHLFAFDAKTGTLLWTRDEPLYTPTVLDGIGYSAGGESGDVSAFDTATGSERWRTQLGGNIRNVAIAGELLYTVSDGNNAIYALDAATGAELWSFPVDSGNDGGIAVHGGVAYVATVFGSIFAVGGTDQGAIPSASPVASPTVVPVTVTEVASPVAATGPVAEFIWQVTGGPEPFGKLAADPTIAPDGRIWVSDSTRSVFQIFDEDGKFVETWGMPGAADGQFNFTRRNGDSFGAIAFAPDDSFYVADTGNQRIQHFAADRTFVETWGGFGGGDGQFISPIDVAVDADGNVFVDDDNRNDVQKFAADGRFLAKFGGPGSGEGQLDFQSFMDVDPAGNVWVADDGRVAQWDNDGAFMANWTGEGHLVAPLSVAVDERGHVFVSDADTHQVLVLDQSDRVIAAWGSEGIGEGQFSMAAHLALDGQGNVYVLDLFGPVTRLQKFRLLPPLATAAEATPETVAGPISHSGPAVELVWEASGGTDGLDFPGSLALDPQGRLWVADTGHDRFAIFSPDGTFIETWGSRGSDEGEFMLERRNGDGYGAVAFASDGSFYVLDVGNFRVQKFAADRTFVSAWGGFGQPPGTFTDPIGIAVDSEGTVYVLDDARNVVERYSPDGVVLGSFDAQLGGVNTGNAIGLDAAGNVYVTSCCAADNRLLKFDPAGTLIAVFGAPGSGDGEFRDQPMGIAVDAAGRAYVGQVFDEQRPGSGQVMVFDVDGKFLTAFGAEGIFSFGIALDDQGNVYVTNSLANTIQKFRLLPPLAPA